MPNIDAGTAASVIAAAKLPDFSVGSLERACQPAGQPVFQSDPDLTEVLENVIDNNSAILGDGRLGFAIVDLTEDPARGFGLNRPAYAGVNDTVYGTVASLAKLLPLYGAYQLRYDLREYIKESATSIPDVATLANRVRQGYRILNAAEDDQDIPLIENIFSEIGLGSALDFWRGPETDPVLDGIADDDESTDDPGPRQARTRGKLRNVNNLVIELNPLFGTPPPRQTLYFFQQLRLMAGWSDDISAAIVIEALGFQYLWQLAKRSDLFRNYWDNIGIENSDGYQGGLFLARDYWATDWVTLKPHWSVPPEEVPPHSGGVLDPVQGGTARSVALLMTKLAQNCLVGGGGDDSLDAHHEIREILRKDFIDIKPNGDPVDPSEDERGEVSPIGAKFMKEAKSLGWTISQTKWPGKTPPTELAVSKIGLIPGHASNAILVRAGRGAAVPITAVLVGINRRSASFQPLFTFGEKMADLLAARHSA